MLDFTYAIVHRDYNSFKGFMHLKNEGGNEDGKIFDTANDTANDPIKV